MKIPSILLATLLISSTAFAADTHQGHAHDHKTLAGPKGGKVLDISGGHAEFFVRPDQKVSVTFYDVAMKPLAPAAQEIKVIAEAKSGNVTLPLEKSGDAFLSKTALPEGDGYLVVVQIKQDATSKPQNFRIKLDLSTCSGCKRAEYACFCDGH